MSAWHTYYINSVTNLLETDISLCFPKHEVEEETAECKNQSNGNKKVEYNY